jgi:hypothetical protein
MTEDEFWAMVEQFRVAGGQQVSKIHPLLVIWLLHASLDQVKGFAHWENQFLSQVARNSALRKVIRTRRYDYEKLRSFTEELIFRGEFYCKTVLANPDVLHHLGFGKGYAKNRKQLEQVWFSAPGLWRLLIDAKDILRMTEYSQQFKALEQRFPGILQDPIWSYLATIHSDFVPDEQSQIDAKIRDYFKEYTSWDAFERHLHESNHPELFPNPTPYP